MDGGSGKSQHIPSRLSGSSRTTRRPLLGVACCFTGGLGIGLGVPAPLGGLLTAGAVCLCLAWRGRRSPWGVAAMLGATLITGWIHADLSARPRSAREFARLMARDQEYVSVESVVVTEPVASRSIIPWMADWTFQARVEGLNRIGVWQQAGGWVDVQWRGEANVPPVSYGEPWLLTGSLAAPEGRRRSLGRLQADEPACRLLAGWRGSRLKRWCLQRRQACSELLGRGVEEVFPRQTGLLRALLLGYRQSLPDDLYRTFAATGTLHIFAISGLHVGLIGLLIVGALKSAGLPRPHWILVLAPLLILYTIATGARPSAVRACIMAVTYWSAPIFMRRPDGPSAFALAALLILAAAPQQLVDPGFIFSFVVVAGLLALCAPFYSPFREVFQAPAWRLAPEPKMLRCARLAGAWFLGLAATSVAAYLSSAPLTAHYFNMFSPIALVGNLIVIPGAFLVVFTGCLSLVGGAVAPILAEVFNHANRVFITGLLAAIDACARVPGAFEQVRAPGWAVAGLWYGGWVGLMGFRRSARRWIAGVTAAGLLFLVVRAALDRDIRITIFRDSGGVALIDLPGDRDVLINTGARFHAPALRRRLRQHGVDRLGVLVLTHPNAQAIGAAETLLDTVPVGEVWCPPYTARSLVMRRVLERAGQLNIPVRYLKQFDRGALPGGLEWEVLHPPAEGSFARGRDASLVIRWAREGAALLAQGGAGGWVERDLLGQPVEVAAPLLWMGNGGGDDAGSAEWLREVEPDWLIVSDRTESRHGPVDKDLLGRLEAGSLRWLSTDRHGDVVIRFHRRPAGRAYTVEFQPPGR
jgi:ComEC/Rec2-related protein